MIDNFDSLISPVAAIAGATGTLITAVATFFLWRVTKVLARETTRMADVSAQPHIIATLQPNKWSMRYFDLHIENSGSSPAYEIEVSFDPPLENCLERADMEVPLQNVSVLKPGQGVSSFVSDYEFLKEKKFNIKITWKNKFASKVVGKNEYVLDMKDHIGTSKLGDEPITQIAKHIKRFDENFSSAFLKSRNLKVDIFTSEDREDSKHAAQERAIKIFEERNAKRDRSLD